MFSTDFLGLSDQKVIKAIRDTLSKTLTNTQNVLVISNDGVLFVWDFESNCVLTLNVKSARSKEGDGIVNYQVGGVLVWEWFVFVNITYKIVANCCHVRLM